MKNSLVFLFISLFFFSLPRFSKAQTVLDPSKGFKLANDFVEFKFEPFGMGLQSMIDRKTGYNHICSVKGKHLLWEVTFGKGMSKGNIDNNSQPCNFISLEKFPDGSQRAILEWNNLRWWKENNAVSVSVTIDLPKNSGIATWKIFVQNNSDYWGLWNVDFPKLNGFPKPGVYDIARPSFASGGLLLKKCSENTQGTFQGRYPSGGWPMQFMSFNNSTNAVYLATMDPDGRAKDFLADASTGELKVVHYPDNMGIAGSDWPGYYPISFGVYQGGWLQAALQYRKWATHQKWAVPLAQRKDIPSSIKNLGLWVRDFWIWDSTNGSPHQMDIPLIKAQKEMGFPIGLHWYFWQQSPFDNMYPEILPSKPSFQERVKDLVSKGFLVMPYINGRSADMNIPDWNNYAPYATYDEAGGFIMDTTSVSGRLVEMCPSQQFWQKKITALTDSMVENYDCNGVYVDQVSAMRDELCFNKNHQHPLGGGKWWTDGNRELLRKIQYIAHRNGHQSVITSEGANELFLDLLDGNLMWLAVTDREIPLINVVYSGYTIFFGSRCNYENCSNQLFNFAQGQAFIDGVQNGWMDLGLFKSKYSQKVAYLRECGEYRVATKDFLLYGRLLGPILPINIIPTFTDDEFGRWKQKHSATVSAAKANLWKSENGHLGIFFANFVDKKIPFSISIDPKEYGLKTGNYSLVEITPNGKIPLWKVSGIVKLTEMLDPNALKVIEIVPTSN